VYGVLTACPWVHFGARTQVNMTTFREEDTVRSALGCTRQRSALLSHAWAVGPSPRHHRGRLLGLRRHGSTGLSIVGKPGGARTTAPPGS